MGGFIVTFPYAHILYPSLAHPSIILSLPPTPFLKRLQQISMFHIYTCIKSTSTIFTFLFPLDLPSPSSCYPTLNMICFTVLSFIVYSSVSYLYCSLIFFFTRQQTWKLLYHTLSNSHVSTQKPINLFGFSSYIFLLLIHSL
jgi:hypothetical protein